MSKKSFQDILLPKVSVIIVNYNGKHLLSKCLESLSTINYKNLEVILVDNNSTDESIEFVTKNYPSIILLKLNKNKGFAEPNNLGAKLAKGGYILFLNNIFPISLNNTPIAKMCRQIRKWEIVQSTCKISQINRQRLRGCIFQIDKDKPVPYLKMD